MGQDENKNFNALEELNRISADSNPNTTSSTGSGDIVLHNNGDGKGVKKIALVAIIILAIVAVVVIVILGIKTVSDIANAPGDYKKEYNQFANYLISGEKKETVLEESNNGLRNYAFNKAFRGEDEEKKKFIEEAYGLFEKFYTDFSAADIKDDVLKTRAKSYYGVIKMLYLYETSDKLEDAEIIQEYMEKSEANAKKLINDSYSKMSESDSEAAKAYAELLKATGQAYLVTLVKYNNNGCISKEKGIDRNCTSRIPYNDADIQDYMKKSQAAHRAHSSALVEIINECWTLSEMINKGEE